MTPDDPIRRRRAIEMRAPRDNRFSPHTPMGVGAEFDAIRRMLERWGPRAKRIGDDAAVITTLGDRAVVASTDTSVENVHFRRDWLTPREIGYRAAAAALSDLAAMGARPIGILAALTVPESWRGDFDAISDGIGDAAENAGAPILGGDTTRGSELSLTITVIGTARDLLCRTSARPGDRVYVTGRLGGPLAALRDMQEGRIPSVENRIRFAHPLPRIEEAAWLAENGAAAAVDISDGLAADLGHVSAASRVGITVRIEDIPTVSGMSAIEAAGSGEEYELIVTSPADMDVGEFTKRFNLDLTQIGAVSGGAIGVVMTQNGEPVISPAGYLHFTE
ncbi:MAG: thiamine-phosphate kinase [Gemmatimonadales bacterium]